MARGAPTAVALGDGTTLLPTTNRHPQSCKAHSWPDLTGEEAGTEGLPTFLHKLPPTPGPLSELLRVRLLDACPLMQAVHEVATQAVPIVNSLHGPLVVPNLGTEACCEAGAQGSLISAAGPSASMPAGFPDACRCPI